MSNPQSYPELIALITVEQKGHAPSHSWTDWSIPNVVFCIYLLSGRSMFPLTLFTGWVIPSNVWCTYFQEGVCSKSQWSQQCLVSGVLVVTEGYVPSVHWMSHTQHCLEYLLWRRGMLPAKVFTGLVIPSNVWCTYCQEGTCLK